MPLNFEKHASKGNEFVNSLMEELDTSSRDKAGRVLRSVLRALRNLLTVEESIQLLAQLPMPIKAVYIDGWKFQQKKIGIKTFNDLAKEVIKEANVAAWRDFSTLEDANDAIIAVLQTMSYYVSHGEMEDILSVMPKQIGRELKRHLPEVFKGI